MGPFSGSMTDPSGMMVTVSTLRPWSLNEWWLIFCRGPRFGFTGLLHICVCSGAHKDTSFVM